MKRIDLIAGARPNFMKIAPIIRAICETEEYQKGELRYRLVHTGQHYDNNMSENFFKQLGIPLPDVNLEAGGGTQAEQTSKIMLGYEKLLIESPYDITLVVGDVTSTMACSIVAKKQQMMVAHVEAGIRSGDMTMPEEINRIVTDSISDYFFTTTSKAGQNLLNAGISQSRIFYVGNVMIDTLLAHRMEFRPPSEWNEYSLKAKNYFVMTLHRPANVDDVDTLQKMIDNIVDSSRGLPIIWPIHPRSRKSMEKLNSQYENLILIDPLGYLEFNYLVERAKAVITDSGGITEETTVMGVPCMTLRDNTERPETVELGTNRLLGTNPDHIRPAMDRLFDGLWSKGEIPPLWDGLASKRIIDVLLNM